MFVVESQLYKETYYKFQIKTIMIHLLKKLNL